MWILYIAYIQGTITHAQDNPQTPGQLNTLVFVFLSCVMAKNLFTTWPILRIYFFIAVWVAKVAQPVLFK